MNNQDVILALRDHVAFNSVLAAMRGVQREATEEALINVFLETIVEEYKLCMAWYGSYSNGVIKPIASAGRVDKYLDNLVLHIEKSDSPDAQCAMSRAILEDHPFGYADLENDSGFRRWRDYALELGYRSNLALPLKINDRIEGGVMIYAVTPMAFPKERVSRLQMLSVELGAILHQWKIEKDAVRNLEQREETIQALLNATTELAMLLDTDGTIRALNKAAAQRLQLDLKEAVGKNVFERLEPHVAARRRGFAQEIIESRKSMRVTDESRGRYFDTNVHPVFDEKGNVAQFALFAQDITEKKEAEQKLTDYRDKLRSMASRLSLAEEKERRRIANEVHDNIGQNLAFSKMKLGELEKDDMLPHCANTVREVITLIETTIKDTRSLVSEISPPVLYELGFEPAVKWLVKETEKKHRLSVGFQNDDKPKPLHDDVKVFLFQAVRELLANMAKHSKATECTVTLKTEGDKVRVDVEDNGIGFDGERIDSLENRGKCFGFFSIRERLEPIGGRLKVYSEPSKGTRITLLAPLVKEFEPLWG